MDDVALEKRRAARHEPGRPIERQRVDLRVERSPRVSAGARVGEQRSKERTSDTAAAVCRQHRHASDLDGLRVVAIVTPGRDRDGRVPDERVASVPIVAVVIVDLLARRDALFVDEHGEPNGQRFVHARAIGGGKHSDIHRHASDSRRHVELRVMVRIHLCTGLLERDGRVLVVGNEYPNQPERLWNLPGGRQEWNETAPMTVARELREETGLAVRVGELAYVAESFDHAAQTHVTAFCFAIEADGEPAAPTDDSHVRACRFATFAELPSLLTVRVVREPLLGYLDGRRRRYFGYLDAGITIAFADGPAALAATGPDANGRASRRHDARE